MSNIERLAERFRDTLTAEASSYEALAKLLKPMNKVLATTHHACKSVADCEAFIDGLKFFIRRAEDQKRTFFLHERAKARQDARGDGTVLLSDVFMDDPGDPYV